MSKRWLSLAIACGAFYPLLVYFGLNILPPGLFVIVGLALIGTRFLSLSKNDRSRIWLIIYLIVVFLMLVILLINPSLAVKAYPIFMSLIFAGIFGLSLLFPPSAVERIARIREPNLPIEGVLYTRKVTIVWTVFLLINASISLASALWGSVEQWTLWNGLISYFCIGILFICEFCVRKIVRA